jgi:NMD protein affecting ribosome stability and mRNA decay
MLEQIGCIDCGESEDVQIGTEQHANNLCYVCYMTESDIGEVF